ncbi:DUF2242 domain-containing protein [Robbsia sp. KACC 23696]|uniref:DUF2242 domain-containing protein n=1 Tax=Robbsia sp. KACC 23696 TaxID=3149231 RepID=UPI00325B91BC
MRHAFPSLMSLLSRRPRLAAGATRPCPKAARPAAMLALSSVLALAACSTEKPFQPDLFSTTVSPYAHTFAATSAQACEAARRAVLSQGYATTTSTSETIDASKGFQPTPENHVSVSFHIVCTPGESSSGSSVIYVNAVQDNYGLKKSDTSASVGLSILGSVSLPIRSNSDSMVKISSQTIPPGLFYERFFGLVDQYLKTVVRAMPVSDADVISSRLAPLASPKLGNAEPVPVIVDATPSQTATVKPLPAPAPPPIAASAAQAASAVSTASAASAPVAASASTAGMAPAATGAAASASTAASVPATAPAPASAASGATAATPVATSAAAH